MNEVLRECHAALVGQTPRLVPADRILYAMRDHTGTVESPFLITASIMSKKLAEDLRGLVLDVKVGSGAFMPSYEQSKLLANLMVSTGELAGTRTVALLTSMDEPLGRFSGNWVEVWECVDIMRGTRHPMSADLIELSNALSGWMLFLAGKVAVTRGRCEALAMTCCAPALPTKPGSTSCARRAVTPPSSRTRQRSTNRTATRSSQPHVRAISPAWIASRSAGPCSGSEQAARSLAIPSARTPASNRTAKLGAKARSRSADLHAVQRRPGAARRALPDARGDRPH